jgi:hypothetical protein
MAIEVLNVVVIARVPAAELDNQLRSIRSGETTVVGVPAGMRRNAEAWPTGSTDPKWPQIRIEYSK